MVKDKHHYVPRLYLQAFASAPKRIHVFHMATKSSFLNVSLRDQCYRKKLYGKTDTVEDALMKIEQQVAPIIKQVIKDSCLPAFHLETYAILLMFIALQSVRTPKVAGDFMEMMDKFVNSVEKNHPNTKPEILKPLQMNAEEMIMTMLGEATVIAQCLTDLGCKLVYNDRDLAFVTSDNPVVKYNEYCEGIKGLASAAPARTGFQMFLPLSPKHLLILYDKEIYKIVPKRYNGVLLANLSDVRKLNLLQAIHAEKVLLFSSEKDQSNIFKVVESAKEFREQDISRIETFIAEDDPHRELVHMFRQPISINLRLSFLRIGSKAAKKTMKQRALAYREDAMKMLDPWAGRKPKATETRIFRRK